MKAVLATAAWRHAVRHPWLVLLGGLGVALGIAVVTAIDLTRASASASFERAVSAVAGRATHHLVGGPLGVDESHYVLLRRAALVENLAPVIDVMVGVGEGDGNSVRLLGLDPLAERGLRGDWAGPGGGLPVAELVTRPGTAL